MELGADKPGVVVDFEDFDEGAVRARAGKNDAGGFEGRAKRVVDLITVSVAFGNLASGVDLAGVGVVAEFAEIGTEAHGAAFVLNRFLAVDEMDDGMCRVRAKFGGVGVRPAADVAGVFDEGHLHAEADAEKGDAAIACVADGADFTFRAADAETAGDEDAVHRAKDFVKCIFRQVFEFLAVDIVETDGRVVGVAAVVEGFDEAFVRFLQFDVFSDERNVDGVFRVADDVADALPGRHVRLTRPYSEAFRDPVVEPLFMEVRRHHINARHVLRAEDTVLMDVAEEGEFSTDVVREIPFAAAEQNIGLYADLPEGCHGMLGRFCLHLVCSPDVGNERDMDVEDIFVRMLHPELTDRLQKWQGLDIADGAADLDDGNVAVLRPLDEEGLDFVRNMGNHLDGTAEVVAVPLFGNDVVIDAAGGAVVGLPRLGMREPLVMPKIHIGLGAILRDINLAMLERVHRAWIDVDIGIELDKIDAKAAKFEEGTDGRS